IAPKSLTYLISAVMEIAKMKETENDCVSCYGWLADKDATDNADDLKNGIFKKFFDKTKAYYSTVDINTKFEQKSVPSKIQHKEKSKNKNKASHNIESKTTNEIQGQNLDEIDSDEELLNVKLLPTPKKTKKKVKKPTVKIRDKKTSDNEEQCSQSIETTNPDRIDFQDFLTKRTEKKASKPHTGEYEVVLVLDSRERCHKDRSFLYEQLIKKGVPCEQRNLSLGDVL